MIIKYIDSDKKEYDLLNPRFRLKSGNFHKINWKYVGLARQYGVVIERFEKEPVVLELVFSIKGEIAERKNNLDQIHASMERDKIKKVPGRIVWQNSYLEGYFMDSITYPEKNNTTANETTFLAPYPFWITEQKIEVKPISNTAAVSEDAEVKTYPYTYPYRYPLLQTETNAYIDHYTESDFKMVVFGPTTSVLINIAGHPYEVNYPLEAGEYMVIDSRPNTPKEEKLYVVRTNGTKESIFNYRSTENSVFKKVPPGQVKIDYARTYGMELIIYKERSEPSWKS